MSVIATAVKHLLAAGVTGDALVDAIAEMEAAQPKDAAAERRRERDREYQAEKRRRNRQISADSSDDADPALSPAPNENNSNPHPHTHPECDSPRARKADPWPKPDWADPQHWTDLKANRKAKRLPNTPTAYTGFIRDIEKWVDDDWPPGRLLEAIVARGWASARYDPRENDSYDRPTRQTELRPRPDASRGERPNRCLDMLYAAEAEIRAAESAEPDFQARPALRAIAGGGP